MLDVDATRPLKRRAVTSRRTSAGIHATATRTLPLTAIASTVRGRQAAGPVRVRRSAGGQRLERAAATALRRAPASGSPGMAGRATEPGLAMWPGRGTGPGWTMTATGRTTGRTTGSRLARVNSCLTAGGYHRVAIARSARRDRRRGLTVPPSRNLDGQEAPASGRTGHHRSGHTQTGTARYPVPLVRLMPSAMMRYRVADGRSDQ